MQNEIFDTSNSIVVLFLYRKH